MALLRPTLTEIQNLPAQEIDRRFGLPSCLEVSLDEEEAYGDGLTGAQALYTDYRDLLIIHNDLRERGLTSFADLGAGNCRSKILFDYLDSPFISAAYEFAHERIEGAKKCYRDLNLKDEKNFFNQDLRSCDLSSYESFLIYLPVGETLDHVIEKLKVMSLKSTPLLYVIESHGDLIPYLEDRLPHLHLLKKEELHGDRHDPFLRIYQLENSQAQIEREEALKEKATKASMDSGGFSLSGLKVWELWFIFSLFREDSYAQFLVREDNFKWLASVEKWTYGIQKDTLETHYPYRIHHLNQLQAILWPPSPFKEYVKERRDLFKPPLSALRKIIVSPKAALEFAGGEIQVLDESFTLRFPQI